MKFIVDAHIPPSISTLLKNNGFDSIHTLDLPEQNETTDESINAISIRENRIVITKDSDFYNSFVLRKIPYKLILVKTGNISTSDLKLIFNNNFNQIINLISEYSLIEIYRKEIIVQK